MGKFDNYSFYELYKHAKDLNIAFFEEHVGEKFRNQPKTTYYYHPLDRSSAYTITVDDNNIDFDFSINEVGINGGEGYNFSVCEYTKYCSKKRCYYYQFKHAQYKKDEYIQYNNLYGGDIDLMIFKGKNYKSHSTSIYECRYFIKKAQEKILLSEIKLKTKKIYMLKIFIDNTYINFYEEYNKSGVCVSSSITINSNCSIISNNKIDIQLAFNYDRKSKKQTMVMCDSSQKRRKFITKQFDVGQFDDVSILNIFNAEVFFHYMISDDGVIFSTIMNNIIKTGELLNNSFDSNFFLKGMKKLIAVYKKSETPH